MSKITSSFGKLPLFESRIITMTIQNGLDFFGKWHTIIGKYDYRYGNIQLKVRVQGRDRLVSNSFQIV